MYRVFHQGLNGKRKLYPVDEIWNVANDAVSSNDDADYYESIYLYSDKHLEILKKTSSLAGIKDVVINRIVLDFDYDKKDGRFDIDERIEMARLDTIHAVKLLYKFFESNEVQIYHSGSKGFHVIVETDKYMDRAEFEKNIKYFGEGLNTFDTKIKDQQRLFRFPLTKNLSTGRYKIPLTFEELNSNIDEIKTLSSNPDFELRYSMIMDYKVSKYPQELDELLNSEDKVNDDDRTKDGSSSSDFPDMSRKPKHLTAAKYVLQEGFFNEGERNEACMILATTYKYLGYNKETTYNIIKATLRLRQDRLGLPDYDKEELWNTIVNPVYSPTWKGGTYTEEDGLLKTTIERYSLDKASLNDVGLVEIPSVSSIFREFATNIESNTIKLGIEEIDRKVRITTGMLVPFLASPGGGKSSLSFNILNTMSKAGEKAIFFSLDMGAPQVFQRLLQKHTGHSSDKILEAYEKNNKHQINEYERILKEEYANIKFCFKTSMNHKTIRDVIIQEYNRTGSYPKMVLLDYLECIQSEVSDPTQSKAVVALALKDIANEFNICMFLLTQPSKISGDPSNELTSYFQIKGSGVVAEQATIVLTMSRPGFDPKYPENDNFVTINVVKNRLGPLSSTDLHWEGATGHIRSLTNEEMNELKALRAEIAQEKSAKNDRDLY